MASYGDIIECLDLDDVRAINAERSRLAVPRQGRRKPSASAPSTGRRSRNGSAATEIERRRRRVEPTEGFVSPYAKLLARTPDGNRCATNAAVRPTDLPDSRSPTVIGSGATPSLAFPHRYGRPRDAVSVIATSGRSGQQVRREEPRSGCRLRACRRCSSRTRHRLGARSGRKPGQPRWRNPGHSCDHGRRGPEQISTGVPCSSLLMPALLAMRATTVQPRR